MSVYLTRRERFNAAHKLWNPSWSDDKNHEVFGKCANENWHGHNYELFVTVKGTPNPETGYCMDLKVLSEIIKKKVINKIDHRNINIDVDFMEGKMASTENLAIAFWEEIENEINTTSCQLYSIEVFETENNSIKYFGPNGK